MTISTTDRKAGPFDGNDVTVDFPFTFKVFSAADLYVIKADSAGAETVLVLSSDFTVSLNADQDSNPGGTLTLPAALATGYTLTITSDIDILQPVELTNMGGFYPTVINTALDRLTMLIQQVAESVARSVKFSVSTPSDEITELPSNDRANKALGFDALGALTVFAMTTGTTLIEMAQAAGSALVGFIQAGTGAVATTAQEKMRQTVSVFDFLPASQIAYIKLQDAGIASQDATIVTAAIQAALDTGYDVFLPCGLYLINGVLDMTVDGQIFYGEGRKSVLYKKAGVHPTAIVRIEDNPYPTNKRQRMHVRDMLIYTPETTTTRGIRVFSAEHTYITDVTVNGAFAQGIFNDYSTLLYLTRVSLWGNQVGFRGMWGYTGVGSWIYLTDCFVSGGAGGIWIEDTAAVSINHCIITACTDFGIWIDRTAGKAAFTVDNVIIHNCDVDSCLDNGIRLTDLDRPTVSDTWVSCGRDATDYKDGIYAILCNELTVSNCNLYNNGAAGLHLDACTDSLVIGNKATGNKTYGIWTTASTSGTTFIGNTCSPTGPLYTQPNGIAVDNGDYNIIVGNNCQGHGTNDIYDGSGANGKRIANVGVADRSVGAVTVANLPTAASVGQGARHMVSDATVTTFASIVAGGGANIVPVYSDGTKWLIG
jgi:parallel beta-helix repeat protein